MTSEQLILKRASASRSSLEWTDGDYDVLCDYEYLRHRSPSDGHEPDQDADMKAFAKSWRRE
jgi:hypothetical protein